ncbi:uncharacterized protein TNCV_759881 [Trichonephila clavipes]|nr:uncharacterized protein TNCV_759881 [Trichonephila clavipes]
MVVAIAERYRYWILACLAMSSSPVPLKTRRVGQRCALNLFRAETSSCWCGVVVRREGASSGVVHITLPWFKFTWSVAKSPRVTKQCDVNIQSINQLEPHDAKTRQSRSVRIEQVESEVAHRAAKTPEQSQARRRHTFGYALFFPPPALRGLLTRF